MCSKRHTVYIVFATALFLLVYARAVHAAPVRFDYLYNLSNFQGVIPYNWATMFVDNTRDEVYVSDSNGVSIFNSSGMETYTFGDGGELGNITSGAVDKDGNIILLSNSNMGGKFISGLMRCNYRGELKSRITLEGLPDEFSKFQPQGMVERDGKLYLVNLDAMQIVVVDQDGKYLDGYDIASILGIDAKKVGESGLTGFSVDKDGNMYFTIAVNFRAYRMTPDHKIKSWGVSGSSPGKFSVVKGIATDDKGNIYVVDALKASVIVFDKNLKFVDEFGGRGYYEGGLISPSGIVIDGKGQVYVNQSANRGVNVYKITD